MPENARQDGSALDLLALYRLVLRAERHLRAPIDAAAKSLDLASADILLLLCCKASLSGASQRELARELSISPAQVSGRLESLRKRGLLMGSRSSNDRRKQFWNVTPRGEELTEQIRRTIEACPNNSGQPHWSVQLGNALTALDSMGRAA